MPVASRQGQRDWTIGAVGGRGAAGSCSSAGVRATGTSALPQFVSHPAMSWPSQRYGS
jgi:hypothetical protein